MKGLTCKKKEIHVKTIHNSYALHFEVNN